MGIQVCIAVFFLVYIRLVTASLKVLSCVDVAGYSFPRLLSDTSVECWRGGHIAAAVFAVLGLVVYGIGVPLSMASVVVKNRHRLGDAKFKKVFGFLYDGFRTDSALALSWDSIILLRRLLITSVTILFATDAYVQALGASLVTMAFIIAHMQVKPFTDPLHNLCEFL